MGIYLKSDESSSSLEIGCCSPMPREGDTSIKESIPESSKIGTVVDCLNMYHMHGVC